MQPQHMASISQTPAHLRSLYAEQVAALHLSKFGLVSATSTNQNSQPYDLIFDYFGRLFKIQVKSKMPFSSAKTGAEIKTTTKSGKHYYKQCAVDLFFVLASDPVKGEVYWLLPAHTTKDNLSKVMLSYNDEYCYSGMLSKELLTNCLTDVITNQSDRNNLSYYFNALLDKQNSFFNA